MGDNLDGIGSGFVGIGPSSNLVQIVADLCQFPVPFSLDLCIGNGPCFHPGHGATHQLRHGHLRSLGLGLPPVLLSASYPDFYDRCALLIPLHAVLHAIYDSGFEGACPSPAPAGVTTPQRGLWPQGVGWPTCALN